jgi:hypothetical protein
MVFLKNTSLEKSENRIMNKTTKEIVKLAKSKYDWLKVSESELKKGVYMIEDIRFGQIPFSVYKNGLSESELVEELKSFLSR